jgi:hypothetical protein
LEDARRSLVSTGSHRTADTENMLIQIERDKKQCTSLIGNAIEGSWIGYANAMGLVYHPPNTPESRCIVSMSDLRSALKLLAVMDMVAAVYFITGYTRDVLYKQVLWGGSHQEAVEDYVMAMMSAKFSTHRLSMQAGHKTCVGILYGKIYNHKKQKLSRALIKSPMSLGVARNGVIQPTHWKRPKDIYFVHTSSTNTGADAIIATKMVRAD